MMESMPLAIRLATLADLDELAKLHCECLGPEDHVPVMLGKEYVRATYRWLVGNRKAYALVAVIEGEIAGLIAVCDGPFTRPMFFACLPEFCRSLARNPGLLFKKKLWRRFLRRPDVTRAIKGIASTPGFAQMTIGAVDARYRGRGVFPALVEATKTYSEKRGSRAIRAGIYKRNTPSRRVFIKGGWIETPELETRDTVFYVAYLDPTFRTELGVRAERTAAEK